LHDYSWCTRCLLLAFLSISYADDKPKSVPDASQNSPSNRTENPGSNQKEAASQRNENVWVNRIDTETQRDESSRLGGNYIFIVQPLVERNYYATEFGAPVSESLALRRSPEIDTWHGEMFEVLRNSVFNARSFFQVGPVLPSRLNNYGAVFNGKLPARLGLSGNMEQRKMRGVVNGNVNVPLMSERTPTASDPAARAIISRFLSAYPGTPPNLPNFDPRGLNTNAPLVIDETNAGLRLDKDLGPDSYLSLSHTFGIQDIDAFQFVAGQNPDTSIRSHTAKLTYRHLPQNGTEFSAGITFARTVSDLRPEPNAVGPHVIVSSLTQLGPSDDIPIKRVQNSFRYGVVGYHRFAGSKHTLTFGGDIYRVQLNGSETSYQRGFFQFYANYGFSAIESLLAGKPSKYEIILGNMNRGFRNWTIETFVADQWRVNPKLQIYYGLRHNSNTTPKEVNNLNTLPYKTDWNNFSPRVSLAYRAPKDFTIRASYTISYGQIAAATYSQIRYNPPLAHFIILDNPDLVNPLKGINLNDPNLKSSIYNFSPDMVSPYSHQYSLVLERSFLKDVQVRVGYLGSRSFKLLNGFVQNRAVPVDGIPLTSGTVEQRRPDPCYYDVRQILNSGIAYFDAAQASVQVPHWKGLAATATYTFSKAIDQGSNYLITAATKDLDARNQYQYDYNGDKRALSSFDSPHSLLLFFSYDLPKKILRNGILRPFANGWQISGNLMVKTGTPFGVTTGSDAPGYGNVDGSAGDRPDILDPSILGATAGNPNTAKAILQRNRFAYISPGANRGNLGYRTFRKDGIQNMNLSLGKQWNWGGARNYSVRFRAEAINFANHPQFSAPNSSLTSTNFGLITNTSNDGRVLQFGLRLSF
jgi:hypothetical protein